MPIPSLTTAATVVAVLLLIYVVYRYRDTIMTRLRSLRGGEGFQSSNEPPRTWEPNTATFDNVDPQKFFDGSQAYSEGLKSYMDPAIIASHRQYTSDTDFLATHGASHASARDDFTPPVQWHGLPRRAHYAQIGCERSARVSQTETPEETVEFAHHHNVHYEL